MTLSFFFCAGHHLWSIHIIRHYYKRVTKLILRYLISPNLEPYTYHTHLHTHIHIRVLFVLPISVLLIHWIFVPRRSEIFLELSLWCYLGTGRVYFRYGNLAPVPYLRVKIIINQIICSNKVLLDLISCRCIGVMKWLKKPFFSFWSQ